MPYETWQLAHDHHLEGMVRCGRVTRVKTKNCVAATVTYPDRGFQSAYLLVLQRNTIGYQDYYVPAPGEPVWVLMQGKSLTRGLILGSAYTKGNPPPFNSQTIRGIVFGDGSFVIYDTNGGGNYQINTIGKVTITVGGDLNATVTGTANIKAPTIKLDGDVHVTAGHTLFVDLMKPESGEIVATPHVKNADGSGGGT
jgi:phage baseplate assembly protein V